MYIYIYIYIYFIFLFTQFFFKNLQKQIAIWKSTSRMTTDFDIEEKVTVLSNPNLVAAWPLDEGVGTNSVCFGDSSFKCYSPIYFGNG